MRQFLGLFILLMLCGVVCGLAVPQTDRPETSYDEVDTPVNQAPASAFSVRYTPPAKKFTSATKRVIPIDVVRIRLDRLAAMRAPFPSQSVSRQELLCVLLI